MTEPGQWPAVSSVTTISSFCQSTDKLDESELTLRDECVVHVSDWAVLPLLKPRPPGRSEWDSPAPVEPERIINETVNNRNPLQQMNILWNRRGHSRWTGPRTGTLDYWAEAPWSQRSSRAWRSDCSRRTGQGTEDRSGHMRTEDRSGHVRTEDRSGHMRTDKGHYRKYRLTQTFWSRCRISFYLKWSFLFIRGPFSPLMWSETEDNCENHRQNHRQNHWQDYRLEHRLDHWQDYILDDWQSQTLNYRQNNRQDHRQF